MTIQKMTQQDVTWHNMTWPKYIIEVFLRLFGELFHYDIPQGWCGNCLSSLKNGFYGHQLSKYVILSPANNIALIQPCFNSPIHHSITGHKFSQWA